MSKGGTEAPVQRKTSGHKVGDHVTCISSGSPWHKVGNTYVVVEHPTLGVPAVKGSDGFYDSLTLAVSRFEKTKPLKVNHDANN